MATDQQAIEGKNDQSWKDKLKVLNKSRKKFISPLLDSTNTGKSDKNVATLSTACDAPDKTTAGEGKGFGGSKYFRVLYTKYAPHKKRKNKSFQDGVLVLRVGDEQVMMYDDEGKELVKIKQSRAKIKPDEAETGSEIVLGGWEIELDVQLSEQEFISGQCFLSTCEKVPQATVAFKQQSLERKKPLFPNKRQVVTVKMPKPLYDPEASDSLVLNREEWEASRDTVYPVVVDPSLRKRLRPHQVEGVQFLYDCICGKRNSSQMGAILADAMGLGKTLQTLVLLYSILKQGPSGRPLIRKALVVAPSSLTANWEQEIKYWFGDARMKCVIIPAGASGSGQVTDFKVGNIYPIAIISYESLRRHADALADSGIGIIVSDEGHRLKSSSGNKTIYALNQIPCRRRILLSGTPVQNNLSELFAMCDWVCPGMLGPLSTFTKVFDVPITRANEKHATADEVSLGAARSNELRSLINSFVLRRDARVNEKFLPELFVYAVFCRPSELQISFMNQVIRNRWTSDIFARDDALILIGDLRKIANHPCLYDETADALNNDSSGKMATLIELLKKIILQMNERAVVVAQSTKMLDVIENVCKRMGITLARLDGSTPVTRRQEIVNSFNMYNVGQVFLLSTTAGGTGLNLIGSNRLIMYDLSWNPASDSQAMARIWRDGQTKPCYIYRLITTGSVEEKIYQRQLLKGEIAKVTVDQDVDFNSGASEKSKDTAKTGGLFSKEELRELFNLKIGTPCLTSEMMKKSGQEYNDVSQSCNDTVLRETSFQTDTITFVYSEAERKGRDGDSTEDNEKCTSDKYLGDEKKEEDCISDLSIPDDFF